ncbi:MAG: hypothetical protein QW547_09425, partial [Candidatus Bathyarchaeia archaeon]
GPGIYTYWIMHATRFLKPGGRLGMIISNLWMQTDYGVGFGQPKSNIGIVYAYPTPQSHLGYVQQKGVFILL